MTGYTVVTHALRAEARKWEGMSEQVVPISRTVDDLTLSWTAFFIGDLNTGLHSKAYNGFQEFMASILRGAVTEFNEIAGALDRAADMYDRQESLNEISINKVFKV